MRTASDDQRQAAAEIFSAGVYKDLARQGKSAKLARLVRQARLHCATDGAETASLRECFDEAFEVVRRAGNRHDYVYRAALAHKVLLGTHSIHTAVMLNEVRVGSNKADVVILNGTSTVYEIKSERDNLKRLKPQVAVFLKAFAAVNVICAERHVRHVEAEVPFDVGLMRWTNGLVGSLYDLDTPASHKRSESH
jgi:hypothetical protein